MSVRVAKMNSARRVCAVVCLLFSISTTVLSAGISDDALLGGATNLAIVLERRSEWLAKACSAMPKLVRRNLAPIRMVRAVKDSGAFQGYRMAQNGECAAVFGKKLQEGDSYIFDFGEHVVGRVSFRLGECNGVMDAPCRLRFTLAELPGELGELPTNWTGLCRSWHQEEIQSFDFAPEDYTLPRRYSFRYVKVDVIACAKNATAIEWLKATAETSADMSRLVPWNSPNPTAGEIDRIACATLRDCMQTMFEDGPKRDRRLWLGDLRIEALANYETFRNYDIVKRSLYLFAGTVDDDGIIASDVYEKPVPKKGRCRIYDYTALFPAIVLEYLMASGDRETAEDLWPLCKRQVESVLTSVDERGLVQTKGEWWYFVDHDNDLDRQVPEQGVVIFGMKRFLELSRVLGRDIETVALSKNVERMTEAARLHFWKSDDGVFLGEAEKVPSWLGQAWMTLARVSVDVSRECMERVLCNRFSQRPRTPYGYYYVTEALYAAGLRRCADDLLVMYWGGMAAKGADTFWEVYVPDDDNASPYGNAFLNSACHAWSCGPCYLLRSAKYKALER